MSKAWSKDIWVDPHTFGGTKACETLADMLNKDIVSPYEKHRILAFLNQVTWQFKCIADIFDRGARERSMLLMKAHFINRINDMSYPSKVISFIKNIVNHHCRKNLYE